MNQGCSPQNCFLFNQSHMVTRKTLTLPAATELSKRNLSLYEDDHTTLLKLFGFKSPIIRGKRPERAIAVPFPKPSHTHTHAHNCVKTESLHLPKLRIMPRPNCFLLLRAQPPTLCTSLWVTLRGSKVCWEHCVPLTKLTLAVIL